MIKKSEIITATGQDSETLMLWSIAALQQLQWKTVYTDETSIVAHTPRTWKKWNDEVTISIADQNLEITSALIHGESFDIKKRNKKNIAAFQQAFLDAQQSISVEQLDKYREQLLQERKATKESIKETAEQFQQTQQVMGNAKPIITYLIIATNVLLFILMIAKGVHLMTPSGQDIFNWGGNLGPATASGQWWRLFTCMFIHIGVIHLAFNMYALYIVGSYLEPMIGRVNFVIAYICTGILASIVSLWWHSSEPVVSAGASGAIFGMYGLFLALLTTKAVPAHIRNALLQSIGIFVLYNLAYGMKSGVDNAAHIGGLISGFAIGYLYYFSSKNREQGLRFVSASAISVAVGLTVAIPFFVLKRNKSSDPAFAIDGTDFIKKVQHFEMYEELALEAVNAVDTASSTAIYINDLKRFALNNWVQCATLMDEAKGFVINEQQETLRLALKDYANQRIEETKIMIRMYEEDTDKYKPGLDSVQRLINEIIDNMKQKQLMSPEKPVNETGL